jgi:hypothetical protein
MELLSHASVPEAGGVAASVVVVDEVEDLEGVVAALDQDGQPYGTKE